MARKANLGDLFNIARLINDLDMREDIISIYDSKKSVQEKGFDIIFVALDKATQKQTEQKVYDVLSGPFEIDSKEICNIDLDQLVELCEQCFTLKTVVNFIKRVSKRD